MALFLTCFAFFQFVEKISDYIAFRELSFLVACIQLLAGSLIAFYIVDPDPVFMPEGTPEEYFSYAIPGVSLFGFGMLIINPRITDKVLLEKTPELYDLSAISIRLVLIGLVAAPLSFVLPKTIAYFFNILSYLSFVGGFMLVFTKHPAKWLWILVAFSPTILNALSGAIFYLVIIWLAFLFLYFFIKWDLSFGKRILVVLTGIILIMALDTSKNAYREMVLRGGEYSDQLAINKLGVFIDVYFDNFRISNLTSEGNLSGRTTRMNQGAVVTWVMNHVPQYEPYAEGLTIYRSFESAILPRFIKPDKMIAGGQENYENFTGRYIGGTSINISLLGEGYANFGYFGGILFMLVVGMSYSIIYRSISNYSINHPIYVYFISFLLIYTIKAEDDLMTPLNHFVKAGIVFLIFNQFYFKELIRKYRIPGSSVD